MQPSPCRSPLSMASASRSMSTEARAPKTVTSPYPQIPSFCYEPPGKLTVTRPGSFPPLGAIKNTALRLPLPCVAPVSRAPSAQPNTVPGSPKQAWPSIPSDTHRHTTHHSSMAQISYLHHPFYGQMVEIVRWLRHHTADSRVVTLSDGVQMAIPSWMLDPLACSQMREAPEPSVSVDALLRLRDLRDHSPSLRTSEQPPPSGVSQPKGVRHAQESSSLSIAPEPTPLCPGTPLATAASPPTSPVSRPPHPTAPQCHPQRAQQGDTP